MSRLRWWLTESVLLRLVMWVCPGERKPGTVWQLMEVPRRITRTEAAQIAEQVRNL